MATTQAKNDLSRKAGFSPAQWVLGRQIRLPASLTDDGEVCRIGALAAADTPGTRFYRKHQLRMAAREAFAKVANSESLRRAEWRQVRPSRGPFPIGAYVFYYDAQDREPGPNCWRGVGRVVGHEGKSTVWVSHRGILLAVSPEQLSLAVGDEIQQWLIVAKETELIDAMPAAGGTGFLDLRRAPKPDPMPPQDEEDPQPLALDGEMPYSPSEAPPQKEEMPAIEAPANTEPVADVPPAPEVEDLSSTSTSMARMRYESERDAN